MKQNNLLLIFGIVCFCTLSSAQEGEPSPTYKNQVATNLALPIFESFDLNYERTIANKWAIGIAGAIYGNRVDDLATSYSGYRDYRTKYELMPFVRIYFQGAQNKSHFVEVFGSLSEVDESGRYIRFTNAEGYGVYAIATDTYTVGGMGAGYGYRFLLLSKKLVLEAQFGLRTNFNVDFIFLNAAAVRTGIKVGYRF